MKWLASPRFALWLIVLSALAFRLALLPSIAHPGIADPNHYFNVAQNLLAGRGLVVDYVWQFNIQPESISHPDDHWMPLTSYLTALSMMLFGQSVQGALGLFVLMGAGAPVLSYAAGRLFGVGHLGSLFAALCTAFLPDLVLRSLQTDTTLPFLGLLGGALLALIWGAQHQRLGVFVLAGGLGGLAYLVRNDAVLLLPLVPAWGLVLWALSGWTRPSWGRISAYALAFYLPMLALMGIWFARNYALFGTLNTSDTSQMFFYTHIFDHYVWDTPITFERMLALQGWGGILAKRLFEMAASLKVMLVSLDVVVLGVLGGMMWLIARRDRERARQLAPVLILLLGAYVFYTLLVPMKNEGGSFKKFYLALVPLLLPLAGMALEWTLAQASARKLALGLVGALLILQAWDAVRLDSAQVRSFLTITEQRHATLKALGDANGDGEIIVMSQDPFIENYFGLRAVMAPYEDLDSIVEVAQRYGVDYVLLPTDRPSLDALRWGDEQDARIVWAGDIPRSAFAFFRFVSAP